MASDRSYRKALPLTEIVAEFRKETGHQCDPRVVDVMLQLIEQEPPQIKAQPQAAGQPVPDVVLSGPRSWAQHMQTIEVLGQQLARATSVADICNRIGETIIALVPHDQCRVLVMDDDRSRLEIACLRGTDRQEYRCLTAQYGAVALGEGVRGLVGD